MRILATLFALCIVLLQWPLWVGKGSWLKVWQREQQVQAQRLVNAQKSARNSALDAEVRDLKTGTDAIEERARNELGMVRQDEVFYQILDSRVPAPPNVPPPSTGAAPTVAAQAPVARAQPTLSTSSAARTP